MTGLSDAYSSCTCQFRVLVSMLAARIEPSFVQALLATASKQVELAESLESLKDNTLNVSSYKPF